LWLNFFEGKLLMINRRFMAALVVGLSMMAPSITLGQQKSEISISRQPGILYFPTHIIEKQQLIEKHASKLGLSQITVKWVDFANGGAQQDALVSGNVDIINTGTGQLLLLWDKTKGGIKGITASSAGPLVFVSRDPRIKSLADLGAGDKIAVPTVRVSTQAILLQIAASKQFGPDQWNRFDTLTVQMGHPDGVIAMNNPTHEVKNHFAAPPFQYYELSKVEGAHKITSSAEILRTPLTQGQFITTTRFAEANPKIIQAVRAAAEDAKTYIENNTREAVEIYREITKDKTPTDEILEILKQPGMMDWNLYPQGTMTFAQHLHRIGTLKTLPASWKDYYLPEIHHMPGN
jgi:NitT/TauT family transport system substrate-binding protein